MKTALVLMLIIVGVGYFVFTSSEFTNFDPTQQGKDAKAAITIGMPWKDVIVEAGEPQEYRPLQKVNEGKGDSLMELLKEGPDMKFSEEGLESRLDGNTLPHGFIFGYRFSQSMAFRVTFDGDGYVKAISDSVTMHDLLQYD
ncbi:MAG: hypothetical protein ACPGXK_13580 [Phycisphaerae bacterium]